MSGVRRGGFPLGRQGSFEKRCPGPGLAGSIGVSQAETGLAGKGASSHGRMEGVSRMCCWDAGPVLPVRTHSPPAGT